MQGVPALGTPAFADAAAVEDDVVAAGPGEQAADGKAGVACADHHGVDGRHDDPLCARPAGADMPRPARACDVVGGQPVTTSIDDRRRVGEHVVHGRAPAGLLDDAAQRLVIGVALDAEA